MLALCEPMSAQPSSDVRHLVDMHREQAEDGHKRLRKDLDGVGGKVSSLQTIQTDLLLRVQKLELTPVNVEKVSFSSVQLIAIVVASIALAAGMWQLHNGIDNLQTAVANTAKLQDERNLTQKETLDNLGRQIEMRRVEIQRVRDDLAEFIRQKPTGDRR